MRGARCNCDGEKWGDFCSFLRYKLPFTFCLILAPAVSARRSYPALFSCAIFLRIFFIKSRRSSPHRYRKPSTLMDYGNRGIAPTQLRCTIFRLASITGGPKMPFIAVYLPIVFGYIIIRRWRWSAEWYKYWIILQKFFHHINVAA